MIDDIESKGVRFLRITRERLLIRMEGIFLQSMTPKKPPMLKIVLHMKLLKVWDRRINIIEKLERL